MAAFISFGNASNYPHTGRDTNSSCKTMKENDNYKYNRFTIQNKAPEEEGEVYYYMSKILCQHTKYNYARKQIAKKPCGAN